MVLTTHPPTKRRGHERVGLYLYSPSGPQWPVIGRTFNPLNAELNPICHLLALAGAHHFFHVSRLRVKYKV